MGYVDGPSLTHYASSSPTVLRDPTGLLNQSCLPFKMWNSTEQNGWIIFVRFQYAESGECGCKELPCVFQMIAGVGWIGANGELFTLNGKSGLADQEAKRDQISNDWHGKKGTPDDMQWQSDTGDIDDAQTVKGMDNPSSASLMDPDSKDAEKFGVWTGDSNFVSSQPQSRVRVPCGAGRYIHLRLLSPWGTSLRAPANGKSKEPTEGSIVIEAFILLFCGGCN